jgi:sugar phosphate isomerase/epimerase
MIRLATMSSVCPDWTLDETIAGMKRHGYQGLEPRVEWNHACGIEVELSADGRREVARQLADEGLEICCIATGVRMAAADLQERARHVEDLKRYIDLAGDLSCPLVRTFGGQRSREVELQAVVDYVAAGYGEVMAQAASRDVTVLLETHDDWSCAAPVRAVVEQVDHAHLGVLWDFMHPQRMMEKSAHTFQAIGAFTRHLHAHDGRYVDGKVQVGPLGAGVFDHATPLQLLQEAGFAGYFSIEVIHQAGSAHDADGVLGQYAEQFKRMISED